MKNILTKGFQLHVMRKSAARKVSLTAISNIIDKVWDHALTFYSKEKLYMAL